MNEVVQQIEEARQAQQLARGIALLSVVYEIITYKPPKREHWWQLWRERA